MLEAAAAAGVGVEVAELDVTSSASVDRAIDAIVESTGRLDVVVNNAGIELFGAVHLVSDDEASRQLDTNVLGVVRVARAAVPHMVRQGQGSIVNVGSVAGKVGVPYSGLYAASKHAVEAITEAMHFELAHLGIRVAVVEPGQFATGLSGNSVIAASMPEDSAEYVRWQAFRVRMRQLVGGVPADAQLVADAIYDGRDVGRTTAAMAGRRRRRHSCSTPKRHCRSKTSNRRCAPPSTGTSDRRDRPSHRSGLLNLAAVEKSGSPERFGDRRVVVARGQPVTRARTIVQGSGLLTCSTSKRPPTKRLNPRRDQWLTWPGVLPSWRT